METEVRPAKNQRKTTAAVPGSQEMETEVRPVRNQRKNTAAVPEPSSEDEVTDRPPRNQRKTAAAAVPETRPLVAAAPPIRTRSLSRREERSVTSEEYRKIRDLYEELQKSYQTLYDVGVQEGITRFNEYKRTAEEKFQAYETWNTKLQEQVDTLSESAQTDAVAHKGREKELMGEVKSLKEKIPALIQTHEQTKSHLITTHAQQRKQDLATIHRLQQHDRYLVTVERMVRMYENLTGLTIQAVEEGKRLWSVDEEAFVLGEQREDDEEVEAVEVPVVVFRCRQKGRNAAIDYTLTIPDQPSTLPPSPKKAHPQPKAMVYDPVVRPSAPQQQLPDFLMQPLGFEQEACGFLFYKIMDCLNCEGDESGEEELEGESD
ncbi:uncharacterized protein EV422DRAFT_263941 [Fimicolochytrium jonesii]|uniref:uncharacterized protein n=1 Tax=Fimicolochytrium jonesii TaxID=1396493 RepID=UPI0022FE62D7|nr:uncharacterized protein EV422DRAFT_263941 [Fimicolochytrium jonesii]KAI8817073.1 hypothetical protein EV422DRAFT_263941 [Fimicolochytrium jonesii]